MRSKETVLVTAAAGGTGQFAVQLAKLAGNTVVASCGSDDKAQLLTDLGCDRVINYNREQVKVSIDLVLAAGSACCWWAGATHVMFRDFADELVQVDH